MAHWAEVDENNVVVRVVVTDNSSPNGDEGYQWLIDNLGGTWIKTSYNTLGNVHKEDGIPFRKNYASTGFTYDESRDAFIPPKPEPTVDKIGNIWDWHLDENTCLWVSDMNVASEFFDESIDQDESPFL
jgi:hypothetical protein